MKKTSFGAASKSAPRLNIEFAQLKQAVAAADFGSFRQAAEVLLIRQSTLSRSIQMLEHSFGVAIFVRSRGGVQATAAGRHFLRTARSILEQMDALFATTRSNARGESGCLAVGFCTSLTAGNLRATLLDYKQRFPQIELGTMERSRTRLAVALRNGAIDIHISTGAPLSGSYRTSPLWSERIMAVLPADHPLAVREVLYWTDLGKETILLSEYDPGRELENILNAKLVAAAERPFIRRHDVSRGVIKSLISMGQGISLVLESDIGANFAGLIYRELRDGSGPSRLDFSAVWRVDNDNPALANFIKLLTERYPLASTP